MTAEQKIAFVHLGLEYYISARFSGINGLGRITGNLFHHAVEMLLKAHLSSTKTLEELTKLSHKLCKLWGEFKHTANDTSLDRFDLTVERLDKFERIRYPDKILSEGAFISISQRGLTRTEGLKNPGPKYELELDLMDELVALIVKTNLGNNLDYFLAHLREGARQALFKHNSHPIVDPALISDSYF